VPSKAMILLSAVVAIRTSSNTLKRMATTGLNCSFAECESAGRWARAAWIRGSSYVPRGSLTMIATLEVDILFRVLAFVRGAEHVAVSECCTAVHTCLLEAQGQAAYQRLSIQVQ
jgi:hypothetical protein